MPKVVVNPKEKAKKLVDSYYQLIHPEVNSYYQSKQCAIIAVDLVLSNRLFWKEDYKYWNDVKVEINKL